MKYIAIIFDLDGTLVDISPRYRIETTRNALESFGKTSEESDIHRFWLEDGKDEIIRSAFKVDPEEFWPVYRQMDTGKNRLPYLTVYDDVLRFLTDLQKKKFMTGIVTSAPDYIAYDEIDVIGRDFFDHIIIAKRFWGIQPKPHPMGLQKCLEYMKVDPKESVYIGNGREDVVAAKSAGMLDIFIDRGESIPVEDLQPTLVINSLDELRPILGL